MVVGCFLVVRRLFLKFNRLVGWLVGWLVDYWFLFASIELWFRFVLLSVCIRLQVWFVFMFLEVVGFLVVGMLSG